MPRRKMPTYKYGTCMLCYKDEDNPLLGPILKKNDIIVHTNCMFASSGISQETLEGNSSKDFIEGFHICSVRKEIKRGLLLSCSHCHIAGASVGCVVPTCLVSYHLPCISKVRGITLFKDPFPSYCKRHAPRQDLSKWFKRSDIETPTCSVCLFSILPDIAPQSDSVVPTKRPKLSDCTNHSVCSTPVRMKRQPRRSTLKTPKRITISIQLPAMKKKASTSGFSSWEYSDPLPEAIALTETTATTTLHLDPRNQLPPSLRQLPEWFVNHLVELPQESRLTAYEEWQHETVHGMCCPKAWMHRSCITGFAVSAALHYLKCPYCGDRDTFIATIVANGIWVPDRDAAWELEPGAYADMVPPLPDQSMYMEGDVSFESVATVEVVRLPSAGTSTATNLPSRQSPYMTRSRNRTRSEMPRAPTAAAAAAALTERDSDNQHRQQQQPPRRRYETKAILPMYIRGGHMLLPTVQPNPTRRRYTQQPARRQRSTSLPVAAAARQNLNSSSTQPRDEPPVHQNANEGTEEGDDSILCPVITPVPSSLAS